VNDASVQSCDRQCWVGAGGQQPQIGRVGKLARRSK
jgi:hypothetical protein